MRRHLFPTTNFNHNIISGRKYFVNLTEKPMKLQLRTLYHFINFI